MFSLIHFLDEILEKMFERTDDCGLLNLASIWEKFESIAESVFAKRYADQYFVVSNDSRHLSLLNRFDCEIKAIKFMGIDFDVNCWVAQMLEDRANRFEKVTFRNCKIEACLNPMKNVTHLVIRNTILPELPVCRKLVEFELRDTRGFLFSSLE